MEQPEIQELRTELSDLTTAIEGLGYDLERAVMIGRMLTHSRLSAAQLSEADEDIQPPLWVNDAGNAQRGLADDGHPRGGLHHPPGRAG